MKKQNLAPLRLCEIKKTTKIPLPIKLSLEQMPKKQLKTVKPKRTSKNFHF
jgi:hypothetical protein